MRSSLLTATAAVSLALPLLAACGSDEEMPAEMSSKASATTSAPSEMMSAAAERAGMFEGLNDKSVEGTATIKDGKLMLSGFSSDEGPDLHAYLANGTDEKAVEAGKELGAVAFDEAEQSFDLDGVDADKYSHVVIHCDKAKAVFGAAKLAEEGDMPAAKGEMFEGLNDKSVEGTAAVAGGMVKLAGFSSDEAPDLHLYLANGTDEKAVEAGKELGAVAFDEAEQTFKLDGADAAMYSHLVVHCDKAKAVFSAAKLA